MASIIAFFRSQLFVTPKIPPDASFAGQTVVITGANAGLGKEAARHVARMGVSRLIITARRLKSGEEAREDIIQTTGLAKDAIEVWHLDLGDYDSVKDFASKAAQLPRLDAVVEGAGISTTDYTTVNGHESTITTNVISTFLLALLLIPTLRASAKTHNTTPRLTIVASEVHAWTSFPEQKSPSIFAALSDPNTKTMVPRYMTSKLLEVLAVRAFAPQMSASPVVLNMLNPGLNQTSLVKEGSFVMEIMMKLLGRRASVGAVTYVNAALAGRESHGRYMTDGMVDDGALSGFVRSEEGKRVGERVWEELVAILEEIEPGVVAAALKG